MIYAVVGLAVGTIGAVFALALMLSRAKDQRESARVLASSTAGELVRARDAIDRLGQDLKSERARADALDDELAKTYAPGAADPAAARDLVLQAWRDQHAAARGRAGAVPAPSAAEPAGPGPDDLIDPFAGDR